MMVGDVIGNILGKRTQKDKYSRNMAIAPEKFKTKFDKFQRGKSPTGEKFMNLVDELDDQQLSSVNTALRQKRDADKVLRPFGLDQGEPRDSWTYWRTSGVEEDRRAGKRKEKNPR